jgi:hypothetical protein
MVQDNEKILKPEENQKEQKPSVKRRTLLKALVGLPVIGVFTLEMIQKKAYDLEKKNRILKELGLQKIQAPQILKNYSSGSKLLRIGLIGFGARAVTHANALGYIHPQDYEKKRANGTLDDWLAQENLNVSVTGICDV